MALSEKSTSPAPSSSSEPPLIALAQAEKRYGSKVVLRVERLELHRGQHLLITGPNGSGKSTLMRVLSGVAQLSEGRIVRAPEYDSLRICFVPQSGGLYQNLTLADNIRLLARLLGTTEPRAVADEWYIRGFGLERHLHQRCGELSGGFQRLAAIACAFATRPHGLFVDEPLGGIDAPHAAAFHEGIETALRDLAFLVMTNHSAEGFPPEARVVELQGEVPA